MNEYTTFISRATAGPGHINLAGCLGVQAEMEEEEHEKFLT